MSDCGMACVACDVDIGLSRFDWVRTLREEKTMQGSLTAQAFQRAAVIKEYNVALEEGNTALAERIRRNPDNTDIFQETDAGEYA